jgi:protein SCO1/2/putative membrane protein
MRLVLRAVLLAALWAVVGTANSFDSDLDSLHVDLGPVPPFKLTDQLGRTVTREDLIGKVWVANFFFTRCAGDCSRTNATMAKLQHDLAQAPAVLLLGFSVNPEDDTPEVLRDYGKRWSADPKRWLFLTGPEKDMYSLIEKGFKQAVQRVPNPKRGQEVVHTFSLMVVDARGQIQGYVDGRDIAVASLVKERVMELLPGRPVPKTSEPQGSSGLHSDPAPPGVESRSVLPAVNAALNGTCAVLLLLGYLAVRQRRLLAHQALMLSALAVSAVFLASYLYYHLVVQRGRPTPFGGEGWVRPVYYSILWSHIFLAALATPMALVVARLALRGNLARHVRLARLTLPVWLYVSVTGVVVYWMLYHLYSPA